MTTFIISDTHLGSPYVCRALLGEFLAHLQDGARLVLNGDTIDNPEAVLHGEDEALLAAIVDYSLRGEVIWVEGNHDRGYRPASSGNILFCTSHLLADEGLFIAHGADFDNIMPYHRWFIRLFRLLHGLRIRLGASPVHVAEYAKQWPSFYRYLRSTVRMNAVEHCRENGCRGVVCGHVHYAEHALVDGVAYLNCGAWTELPACFVRVSAGAVELLEWEGAGKPSKVVGTTRLSGQSPPFFHSAT